MSVRTALVVLFTLVTSSVAPAQTLTTVFKNGPSTNRVDLVVLGDGYTSAELPKFASDVQQFVVAMFAQQPYREYRPFFNVYRIDIASLESGADHPESNSFKNTAFDATYNCGGILRLICVNDSKVLNAASASALPSQRDVILVMVNDATYGGSGGQVAVSSIHPTGVELVLHELGHSFGLLADEYGGPPPPFCDSSIEPVDANATKIVTGQLKWGRWIDPQTPIPTSGTVLGVPGLYEGARYCDTGLFRPTYNSKMRSLFMPFEQINGEQLVKRYYSFVSPIQSYSPSSATIRTIRKGRALTFKVTTVRPATHTLVTRWSVDGVAAASGAGFLLDSSNVSLGQHSVRVVSRDRTAMVRSDPSSALQDSVDWLVEVLPSMCDVSADGLTNIIDVQRLLYQILGISHSVSDVNSDGRVNVVDLQMVLNVVTGFYACPAD